MFHNWPGPKKVYTRQPDNGRLICPARLLSGPKLVLGPCLPLTNLALTLISFFYFIYYFYLLRPLLSFCVHSRVFAERSIVQARTHLGGRRSGLLSTLPSDRYLGAYACVQSPVSDDAWTTREQKDLLLLIRHWRRYLGQLVQWLDKFDLDPSTKCRVCAFVLTTTKNIILLIKLTK